MKVLHIEGGKHLYGGPYQVLQLLRLLKGRGEHILACPQDSAIAPEAMKAGVEVLPIPLRGEASVGAYFALREIIREKKPDLVQVHSRRGADLWGVLAAVRSKTPLVITRRVDNPEPRWLARLRYGKAVRVVGISKKICEVLAAEGVPAEKLRCIRSGVDTVAYAPADDRQYLRQEFGIEPDEKTVVMAAQFIKRKGHATLLDAAPAILKAHSRTRFLLLGQGPLHEEIVRRAKAFGDRFIIPGFRSDFAKLLPLCDLLVHPAEMEGLGVVILQAAACGVPVVAAASGGIPEVVRDGESGFLVSAGDDVAVAEKVGLLLSNEARREKMGAFARELAVNEFSIETMASSNFAMYEELLGRRA